MVADVRAGLTASPPSLPCKYLYDDRGSALFDEITRQPEYYQTRTEEALLERVAVAIVADVEPDELVELGSGVGRKVRLILDAMSGSGRLQRCVLFDINAAVLQDSVDRLQAEYPQAGIEGVHGDFQRDLPRLGPGGDRLVLLLGGTIGNILPERVSQFLASVARQLQVGDGFLVGVDIVKDGERLEEAYNDRAGVTAAFNRNVLRVLNRELGADFDVERWEHVAFYDETNDWIEMRLRSLEEQSVSLPALPLELEFAAGEEIRTEISAKYTRASLADRVRGTGLALQRWETDPEGRFGLALLVRTAT